MTTTDTDFVSIERISQSILLLRGYRVIQAVKRNSDRFPGDFMFQLSREDIAALRSQSATPNIAGRGQHGRHMIVDIMKTIRQLTNVPPTRAIGFVLPEDKRR